MDFTTSLIVAASGMRAQTDRMKVIAENIANGNSTPTTPGADPYRRKIATMNSEFDRELNANLVTPGKPDGRHHGLPAAIRSGQSERRHQGLAVKLPNVNSLVEIMDMREAQRSYEADLTVMDASKSMLSRTVDLLRR